MNEELANLRRDFAAHAKNDAEYQILIAKKLDGLATKNDVQELKSFLSTVRIGSGILSYTYNNAQKIGSFVLFIVGIYVVVKYGLVGGLLWLGKNLGL